jgi:glycine cleavage system H protein
MPVEAYLHYKREHFATQLPLAYRYSPTHYWLEVRSGGRLRVGLTKFATRMLGELVDFGFETRPGQPVAPGQVLGWMEGFKAVSDVYAIATGTYVELNPVLEQRAVLINEDPYGEGWLYEVDGEADERCFDAHAYAAHLDVTINRLLVQKGIIQPPPAAAS